MKHLSKVVWSEGMYLGPHHFQVQNRYFEDLAHFVTLALWFEPYGFIGCSLDAEALRNGTASLLHARGVFPDGLIFDMPESDPLPPPREVADSFSPTAEHLLIQLAVAPLKPDRANCRLSEAEPPDSFRYSAVECPLLDENTGGEERRVRLGCKNIRLLFAGESADGWVVLPLARVKRDGSGQFIYDARFIPPCVQIAASDSLMAKLRGLIGVLEEQSATLPRAGRSAGKFVAGVSTHEVAGFWFAHSINTALASLRHLCFSKRGHPEELFVELSRLAGALCTFGLDSHPRTLPLYNHDNLEGCFDPLDDHIRRHLETLMPTNCLPIPLEPLGNYFWSGSVTDQRCLGPSRWIFAIRSPIGEAELIERVPRLAKVCSREFIVKLVQRAMPGLTLTQVAIPPAAVS